MKLALLLVCIALAASSLSAPGGPRLSGHPVDDFDVLHYDLSVRFNPTQESYGGVVVIRALRRVPAASLLLHASAATLTIDSVMHGPKRLPFSRTSEILTIELPDAGAAGDTVTIDVAYHGISRFRGEYDNGGVYFSHDSAGHPHVATMGQPNFAREWWPCKDVPGDKATASITATVPRPLTAVSNGLLKEVTEGAKERSFRWETRYPISTYLVSVSAAEYREFTGTYTALNGTSMPLQYYVYPGDFAKAKKDFRNTASLLRYFAETFCEYPFLKEKFGYAEVDGDLTMENQTIVSVEKELITGDGRHETTLIHEMAHHWWGNLITPASWHHTWLSEGFGTLAEGLYLEHSQGPAAYRAYMDGLMGAPVGYYSGSVIGKTDTAFWDSFSPRVYFKGAIVLHMLRGMIGDSAFFGAVRSYLNDPRLRYGNATTEEFIALCEKASAKDLGWFFSQWIYASTDSLDRPVLRLAWSPGQSASGHDVIITVEQKGAHTLLYRLPMNVTVTWPGGSAAYPIVDSLATQTFRFAVPEAPTKVVLDKEHNVFFNLEE